MNFLEEEWWNALWERTEDKVPLRDSPRDSNYQFTGTEKEVYKTKERIRIISHYTGYEDYEVVCKLHSLGIVDFSSQVGEGLMFYKGVGIARTEGLRVD